MNFVNILILWIFWFRFSAYLPPEKDEEHNEDPLTDAEVKAFADAEAAYQAEQKKLKEAEYKEEKRLRAIARINKI